MSSSYRIELDNWLKTLDVKAQLILDIGGSQLPVQGRTKSWEAPSAIIADLENPHVDSPKPTLIIDLNKEANGIEPIFDLIFCLEVFDYVYNPVQAFKTIEGLLCKGGTAWITFPSFYPLHQPVEDDALRYMPGGIQKLAKAAGLEIVQMIKRRPETDMLMQTWRAERMRAAKHEDHEVTGWIVQFRKL